MVYEFVDVNEVSRRCGASIQSIVNGFNLDYDLAGFRTLNVSGRSSFGRNIETLKYSKRSNAGSKSTRAKANTRGSNIFFGSDIQGVEINVEYMLTAPSNEDFRYRLSKLMEVIHQEEAQWIFTDDLSFYYVGTLSEFADFKEDKNSIVSSFTIVCTDPFKLSRKVYEIKGSGTSFKMDRINDIADMEKLIISPKISGESLIVKNEDQNLSIILKNKFVSASEFIISPDEDINYNGKNIMASLDLMSDKEDFNAQSDETISLSVPCDYEFYYRLRRY